MSAARITQDWWLSSEKMTVWVQTEDGKIVDAAPVVRRFIGQSLHNLARWMKQQVGFRIALLLAEKSGQRPPPEEGGL